MCYLVQSVVRMEHYLVASTIVFQRYSLQYAVAVLYLIQSIFVRTQLGQYQNEVALKLVMAVRAHARCMPNTSYV